MSGEHVNEHVALSAVTPSRFAHYSALLTAILTAVSFAFALYAVPISGANCPENCVEYPYLDTAARFPRDFMWMPLAILLVSAVRWVFAGAFFLAIAALIAISLIYGLERLDRFEVAVISIDWLVLMVNGVLLSILFKRQRGVEA